MPVLLCFAMRCLLLGNPGNLGWVNSECDRMQDALARASLISLLNGVCSVYLMGHIGTLCLLLMLSECVEEKNKEMHGSTKVQMEP